MKIIVIEGDSCAGKTTLAQTMSDNVIHMDDFYMPQKKRNFWNKRIIGGNIDRRRFKKEVLTPLKKGVPFDYGVFSHETEGIVQTRHIETDGIVVVEGSYSMLPTFGRYFDEAIFLEVSPDTQQRRLIERGSDVDAFLNKWIPMEKRYHRKKCVKARCSVRRITG